MRFRVLTAVVNIGDMAEKTVDELKMAKEISLSFLSILSKTEPPLRTELSRRRK